MKKKKNYTRPDSIIVDGEVIHFHTNTQERLKLSSHPNKDFSQSFFSKKFRYLHILLADIFIIAIIGIIILFFIGRSTDIIADNIHYKLIKKSTWNNGIVQFVLYFKNTSATNASLPGNYYIFEISMKDELIEKREIFIPKTVLSPNEQYAEAIMFNGLKKGNYKATFVIDSDKSIDLRFLIQ